MYGCFRWSADVATSLNHVLVSLQSGHNTLPFLDRILTAAETRLAAVPADIMALLRSLIDFTSIRPGEPVWLQLAAPPDGHGEIIIYRAEADGCH